MQKARRHPYKSGLRPLVSTRFQVLFTPLFGVLFTFPSRYWYTIGLSGVFSLTGWCRQIQPGFLLSRPTQDTRPHTHVSLTGLSPSTARIPIRFRSHLYALRGSYNPGHALTWPVWAPPLSLATTHGITVVFSSSGYLDVSVPRVSLPCGIPVNGWVAPFGNPRISPYVPVPADYRSLPRPS